MDRIPNSGLLHFFNSRNFLADEQCGFWNGRQTLEHLVKLDGHIQEAITKKHMAIWPTQKNFILLENSMMLPTSFLCMINDILQAPSRNVNYKLYSNGCTLRHFSNNAEFSANRIQLTLDMIHNWSLRWCFMFSTRLSIGVIVSHCKMPNTGPTQDNHLIPI